MINKEIVEKELKKIKIKIESAYNNADYNGTLELIALAGKILYETNLYYRDDFLESYLEKVAGNLCASSISFIPKSNSVLFWDGFGLNSRGLIQIYLKALCQCKDIIYVTFQSRKEAIPDVLKILEHAGAKCYFISKTKKVKQLHELEKIIEKERPGHFFLYSVPNDVIATTVMYAYAGKFIRYQINLTDHAFWLGAGCIDKCIEFRNYGANISYEYRNIAKDKQIYIPYYPIINTQQKFEGYPFPFCPERQQLIFSGGALYKTIDRSRQYYKIIEFILSEFPNVIFWYAGTGDSSELTKVREKFPGRIYHTSERQDLFPIMERCYFYLNTYPMIGGLMMQYAAAAGKIPLTLRHNMDGSGILINQEKLGIEFDNIVDLKSEIVKLLTDEDYMRKKAEKMPETVISSEQFDMEIEKLVDDLKCGYEITYQSINTDDIRNSYLERIGGKEFYGFYAGREIRIFRYFPLEFFKGGGYKLLRKLRNLIR